MALTSQKVPRRKHGRSKNDPLPERSRHPGSISTGKRLQALQRDAGNYAVSEALNSTTKEAAGAGMSVLPPARQSAIRNDGGRPLDPIVRSDMESRFDEDFSDVRVHTDTIGAESAEACNAKAYTVGNNVVFNRGSFAPNTQEGRRLIAHELSHVIQQSRGGTSKQADSPELQQSADRAAADAVSGKNVHVQGASVPGIARQSKKPDPRATEAEILWALEDLREANPLKFVQFITKNEAIIYRILSPYGFNGCHTTDEGYLKDFDRAYAAWIQKDPSRRVRIRVPTAEEIEARENEVILDALPDGTGYIGKRKDFRRAAQRQHAERALRTLDNIRSGLGGAIGYGLGGDKGSDLGATADALAGAMAGRPGGVRAPNRQNITSSKSVPGQVARPPTQALSVKTPPPRPQARSVTPSTPPAPAKPDVGLADRGYRPSPGERTTTKQEWKKASGAVRWGKAVEKAFEGDISETAKTSKVTGGKSDPRIEGKAVPGQPTRRMDVESVPRRSGETQPQAVARVRTVIGRRLSDHPVLQKLWNDARATVLKNNTLTKDNYADLYDRTREAFWRRVRNDPDAVKLLNDAGFNLPKGATSAPVMTGVDPSIPVEETRISLDHIAEKAQGSNWQRALDADNLRMEFARPNTEREIKQMRHPELRDVD